MSHMHADTTAETASVMEAPVGAGAGGAGPGTGDARDRQSRAGLLESVDGRTLRRGRAASGRRDRRWRAAVVPDGRAYRALAERQVHRPDRRRRGARGVGQRQPADRSGEVRDAAARPVRLRPGPRAVRPGLPRRRRSGASPADPRHHRIRLALALRPQSLHRRTRSARSSRATRRSSRSSTSRASRPIRCVTARTRACSSC